MVQARVHGVTFNAFIDQPSGGIIPARRINEGSVGGFYTVSRRAASNLTENPITLALLVQPALLPNLGDKIRFDITLSVAALPYAVPTITLTQTTYVIFTKADLNATLWRLVKPDLTRNIFPALTVRQGNIYAFLVARLGSAADDTYAGNVAIAETLYLDFTDAFVVGGAI